MDKEPNKLGKELTKKIIAVFDVGGTNTRCQIMIENNLQKITVNASNIIKFPIASKKQLKDFIHEIIFVKWRNFHVEQCIFDFAGPVLNHQSVQMSNWENNPVITLNELIEWGLPEKFTYMFNDIEAAAYGIIDLIENNQFKLSTTSYSPLYEPAKSFMQNRNFNNKFLLMPGTGLGAAGLISLTGNDGRNIYKPIPTEIGHIPCSPIDQEHENIIYWLKKKKKIKSDWPSWEEFVSGRGLIFLYEAILAIHRIPSEKRLKWGKNEDGASIIAGMAIRKKDQLAEKAMKLFYRCAGKASQVLALTYQPFGGIFLCGDVIRKDASFIPNSGFIDELHNNATQNSLLKQFPVYIVLKKNLNILGSLWIIGNKNKINILP